MKKEIKALLIPDVHCREFWKIPVHDVLDNHPDARIIFTGDYVDGYPDDFTDDDYPTRGVANLEEIIKLKKDNPDRVTLLLGNHDCGYAINPYICNCRTDYAHKDKIKKLFTENRDCFQLLTHVDAGQKILVSHAGVKTEFLKRHDIDSEKINIENYYNNAWAIEDYSVLNTLGECDHYRDWLADRDTEGSFIWSDLRSWFDGDNPKDEGLGYQIFGHTYLNGPIINEKFACIDCQRGFIFDEDNTFDIYKKEEIKDEKEKEE
jgi:hypothetical protein